MNHNKNKKFVQQKGNEGNNFGFIYSRQSQSQKNVNDSIEDGEIISSQKNISPDKLKTTPSRQLFQNIDPEAHEKDSDAQSEFTKWKKDNQRINQSQVLNGKSRNNNEQINQNQNLGNENNYNYGQNNYYGQNDKNEQDENDSQSDQSEEKSNENEPEPESMENQEQSQADIFNQNYFNRKINSQQNIGQLSSESNQENGGPQNNRQIYKMQLENENGFNKYEKKEVLKVNQQNYEMSGEEAEMAEMQDDEGVDTIVAERKSIYQKAQLNRQEGQEQWGKNNINLNTQLNQDMYESMSEENEHDIQSGLLQQYQDEEDSSILDKSQNKIYDQDRNSSCLSADNEQQFDIKIDKFQNSNAQKVPSNQDERTFSEMEGTGNKIQGMNENHHDNVNMQDYDMQDADEKQKYEEKQENIRNQINTNRMSRLGFADHELSQSNKSSSSSSDQDRKIEDSDKEEQQYIDDVSQSNQSNSKISRSQKSPDQQYLDESDKNAKQQIQSSRRQSKDQSKQSENSIQKQEDNYNSQLKYNLQKKNETAIKSQTGQKQYLSQQEPIFTSAQKAFRIDDQNTSQLIQQKNNQSRISLQVESIVEDEDESQKHLNIRNSERRSRKSRQKSKISHVIQEPTQNYQVDQSQNQQLDYSYSQQQTVIGKHSRKSQKTLKSQKIRQTLQSRAYKTNIQDDILEDNQQKDSENVQENDSQIQLDQNQQNQQDDESDQYEIVENQEEENNTVYENQAEDNEQSDQEQSDFKIDVEENFVQNDNFSEENGVLRGGADFDNDEDEPIIDQDQDEEEEQSNQDSAFNYQIEGASKNREIEDIQNSESKQQSSNIIEKYEEISNSHEQEESSEQDQLKQENHHSENLIIGKNSQEQIDNDQKYTQILRDGNNYSEEIIESQSENQEYLHEDEDQIEEDSNQNRSDYQIINGQQAEYQTKDIPNETITEQKNGKIIQKITDSEQIDNISKQSEQLNDNQDANQDESEEGENFSSPDTSEVDSSSNFESDLVSEEIIIEPLQQELNDDPLNSQRVDESVLAEQIQKPVRKQKIKKEQNFAQQELSPRKTREQRDLVQEQSQPKKEIEKFTIQRRPRAALSKQEIEIEKKNIKSVEKKNDQQKKVKKDFSQNEKKESKQNKTKHNVSENVEKIEDEVNPSVVLNALRKNARRKVNLNDLKFSQQSLKDNQKSPIKMKEVKKSPIKEKEKKKSPIRVKEKVVKLNYVDKFDVNNQDKSKTQKIEHKVQEQQTLKTRERSPPFSAYQNKNKMIKINQFQIQPKTIKAPEIKKLEKQIDSKKIQQIEKVEIIKEDKLKRKKMFCLTSLDEENVEMAPTYKEKINKKVQESSKLKQKEEKVIIIQKDQKQRYSVRKNDEKIELQIQKNISNLQTRKHSKEENIKIPSSLLGFQSQYSKNVAKQKLKTPSPKKQEKNTINYKKQKMSPIKTRNSLQSPPRVKTRNSIQQSPDKVKTRSLIQSPQKEHKSSKPKIQLVKQDQIKIQTRHSKRESPLNIIKDNDKSKTKKDLVKIPQLKNTLSPKKGSSPLKIQEKQKQIAVTIAAKETQRKENISKIQKRVESHQKDEQQFTRKRDLKYQQKHSKQIEIPKTAPIKQIQIEKIQTRNIIKPDYASLSLGLLQKNKNDIDQNPKQIKTQKQAQTIGLGFFNDDGKNKEKQKIQKQIKEQKPIELKPFAKISLDSFKMINKQKLKTLIATPSKFQILQNKSKINKKPHQTIKQKKKFIIRTRHLIQKPLPEKKDIQKIYSKSKQIKKEKQKILIRKLKILKNVKNLKENIQTRNNIVKQTQKIKENEPQKQKIAIKQNEIINPIIPQNLKKTVQEKKSTQITKAQSPEKKIVKQEPLKLGLLGKKELNEKIQSSRNESKTKSQRSQFQFVEVKRQKVSAEKELGNQINRSSLFGFVRK